MKYFLPTLCFLILPLSLQAKTMSACDHSCFEKKYQCNISKSHTLNNCHEDLVDCKVSCKQEIKNNLYALNPTAKDYSKALAGSIRK